ncbi:MAG: triple tyrosine motif-containing protein, partial [Nitrososphaera sp.]
ILEVIQLLGNNWASYMDYISTHLYPASSLDAEDFKSNIVDKFNISVWNTETGAWDLGFYKGSNSNFFTQGEAIWPHLEAERYYWGSLAAPEELAINFLHSIGNGLAQYFYYDSRLIVHPGYFQWHPTILEYDDTIRSKGIAYAILARFFDYSKGLGNLSSDPNTYAYLFDRGGTPLVALWTADQSNKSITPSTSQFKVYDIMGNEIPGIGSTIKYNRTPVYVEGQGVSVDQLRAAFSQGIISNSSDNTPPNLSIVSCPTGPTHIRNLQLRWIAIDETSVPSTVKPLAILYSHKLAGRDSSWSPWTAKTYVDYDNLNPGRYTFCVQARDEQGNLSAKVCKDIVIIQPQISPPQNLRATFKQHVELSWT